MKKKKLTLTISSKKPYNVSNYIQGRKKTSVVIEKKNPRKRDSRTFYNRNDNLSKSTSTDHIKTKSYALYNFM